MQGREGRAQGRPHSILFRSTICPVYFLFMHAACRVILLRPRLLTFSPLSHHNQAIRKSDYLTVNRIFCHIEHLLFSKEMKCFFFHQEEVQKTDILSPISLLVIFLLFLSVEMVIQLHHRCMQVFAMPGNDEMSRSHADKKDCKQRGRTVACMPLFWPASDRLSLFR